MEELTIETCIEKWINNDIENVDESTAGCQVLHQLINLSEFSFVTLIQKLGNFLTSPNDHIRNKATLLIVELLLVDSIDFNSKLIHQLVIFFNQRLSDYPSVIPSLIGLITISTKHKLIMNYLSNDTIEVLLSLTRNLDTQSLNQNIRQKVFTLMESLLDHRNFDETDDTNSSSIVFDGILAAIEGEKDPRCLTIALRIIQKVSSIFPTLLQQRIERIFEITSCYFPITFNSSPDDPYGVKPEILIQSLQDVLCCHISMCDFVVPLMIDKLNSEVTIAKKHALMCLSSIVVKYDTLPLRNVLSVLSEFIVEIVISSPVQDFSLAKNEILLLDIVSLASSNICKAILQSQNMISRQHEWLLFADPIIKRALQEYTSNPDSILSNHFLHIIQSIGSSYFCCAETILNSFIPVILSSVTSLQSELVRSTSVTLFSPEYGSNESRNIITYSTPKTLFCSLITLIQTLDPNVNYLTLCITTGSSNSIKESRVTPLFPMLTKVLSSLIELTLLYDNSLMTKHRENNTQLTYVANDNTNVSYDLHHHHDHNHKTVTSCDVSGTSSHDHSDCCGGHSHSENLSYRLNEQDLYDIIIHATRCIHELLLRLPYQFVHMDQLIAFVHLLLSIHIQPFPKWLSSQALHFDKSLSLVEESESQLLLSSTISDFLRMMFQKSEYKPLILEDILPFYINILLEISGTEKCRVNASGVDNITVVSGSHQGTYDIYALQISCGILSNLVSSCAAAAADSNSISTSIKLFDEVFPMLLAVMQLSEQASSTHSWAPVPARSEECDIMETMNDTKKAQIELILKTLVNMLPAFEISSSGFTSTSTTSTTNITSHRSKAIAMKFFGLITEQLNQQEVSNLLSDDALMPIREIYRSCFLLHQRKVLSNKAIEFLCSLTTKVTTALGSDRNALKFYLLVALALLIPSIDYLNDESTVLTLDKLSFPALDNDTEQNILLQLQILISILSYIPPDILDFLSTFDTSKIEAAVLNHQEPTSVNNTLAGMIVLLFRRCFLIIIVGDYRKGGVELAANVIAIFLNKLPLSVLLFGLVNTTLHSIQTSLCSSQATSWSNSLLLLSVNNPNLHLVPNDCLMTKSSTAILLVWSIRSLWMRPDITQPLHGITSLLRSEAEEVEGNREDIYLGNDLSLAYFCEGLIQMLISCFREEGNASSTSPPVHDDSDLAQLIALIGSKCAVLSREYPILFPNISYYRASPFWRQKLWSRVYLPISQILDREKDDSTTTPSTLNSHRRSLLLAMGGIVSGMPNTILTSHGPQLVNISVEALSYDSCSWNKTTTQSIDATETSVHVRALEVLKILLQDNVEHIVPFLTKAIPRLCQSAEKEITAVARVTALHCLSLISALPYSLLYPMKRNVLKSLSKMTDDYKRNVRMLAAKVKSKWLSLK